MKKQFFLILLFSFLGFALGRYTKTSNNNLKSSEINPVLQQKIYTIADHELRNYAMAQEAKEKLQAADELYGKVVLLFLADLNLHMDLPQTAKETVWKEDEQEKIEEEKAKPIVVGALDTSPLAGLKKMSQTVREELAPESKLTGPKKTVENFKLSAYSNKMNPMVRRLMGDFRGQLKLESGKKKGQTHGVHLNFDFLMKDKKLDGMALVELIDNKGEVYSTSSGDGSNRNIRQSADDPNLFFIECSPDSFFTVNMKSYPKLRGQFFESDEYRGTVFLQRTN
ncbi:MAG: hypothetical protein ACOYL6_13130 [Bacteriovoracaceae bacterium]